ncbi:hypothetical protein JHL18_02285 [Clostridium sp. YIM B02505]|uniref:Lipoprotein n=1 Tax=Clostridium yunnanense TaxID=2800325 RepID=A0ABS1EJD7_9CLOT|nr:hypothetical protein [Clostridium yunnanense]MBK1809474.1 hypothetical protein [Clostridium yunnanense]
MKGKVIALLISTAFLLVGCGSKGTTNDIIQGNKVSTTQANTEQSSTIETSKKQSGSTESSTTTQNTTNGQAESSGVSGSNSTKTKNVKALTQEQKSEIRQKVGTAINNVNNALKSIQDVPDVDISEANK